MEIFTLPIQSALHVLFVAAAFGSSIEVCGSCSLPLKRQCGELKRQVPKLVARCLAACDFAASRFGSSDTEKQPRRHLTFHLCYTVLYFLYLPILFYTFHHIFCMLFSFHTWSRYWINSQRLYTNVCAHIYSAVYLSSYQPLGCRLMPTCDLKQGA